MFSYNNFCLPLSYLLESDKTKANSTLIATYNEGNADYLKSRIEHLGRLLDHTNIMAKWQVSEANTISIAF